LWFAAYPRSRRGSTTSSGRIVLGLSLERDGTKLRFCDPTTGRRLRAPRERAEEAESALRREAEARQQVEAENERLRQRILELERRSAADA
jgi:hypothetical protein